jgi:hypothetical protein
LKSDHRTEITDLTSANERKIDGLKIEHSKDKQQAIDNLSTDHKSEFKKLKDEHEKTLQRLNASFEQ